MSVRVGERTVGICVDDAGVAEQLRRLLSAHLVDADAPTWFWIAVGGRDGAVREKHALSLGGSTLLRTGSLGHLIRATVANLAELARNGGPRLRGQLLLAEDHAVLVHPGLSGRSLEKAAPQLRRAGYRQAGLATVTVDPGAGDVVLADPAELLELDQPALSELAGRYPPDGREPTQTGVRLPLQQILVPSGTGGAPSGGSAGEVSALSRPAATLALTSAGGFSWQRLDTTGLKTAAALAGAVAVRAVSGRTAGELTDVL